MKVLVSAASKYGATGEIAKAVGEALAGKGLEVTVLPPQEAGAIEEFDAVVLGSAVYMGQWMKPAREPAKPADNPVDVSKILEATKARDHRIFTGKLVKKHLSFPERAMASAIRLLDDRRPGRPGGPRWLAR